MKGLLKLVMAAAVLVVVAMMQQAQGGELQSPVIVTAATSGTNYWANTGGEGVLVKDVISCATGGTLSAKIDMMVGGAGVVTKPACAGVTLSVTNATSRSLTGASTDYVWPGQRLVLYSTTGVAEHKIMLTLERQ
jgi:hypothetical protein